MDIIDAEELAEAVLGITDDEANAGVDHDRLLEERLGVNMEQFMAVADALLPFTITAKTAVFGEECYGFVKDGAFIVKEQVK